MYLVYLKTSRHTFCCCYYISYLLFYFYSVVLNRMCAGYQTKNKIVEINLMSVDLPVAFNHYAKLLEWFHF